MASKSKAVKKSSSKVSKKTKKSSKKGTTGKNSKTSNPKNGRKGTGGLFGCCCKKNRAPSAKPPKKSALASTKTIAKPTTVSQTKRPTSVSSSTSTSAKPSASSAQKHVKRPMVATPHTVSGTGKEELKTLAVMEMESAAKKDAKEPRKKKCKRKDRGAKSRSLKKKSGKKSSKGSSSSSTSGKARSRSRKTSEKQKRGSKEKTGGSKPLFPPSGKDLSEKVAKQQLFPVEKLTDDEARDLVKNNSRTSQPSAKTKPNKAPPNLAPENQGLPSQAPASNAALSPKSQKLVDMVHQALTDKRTLNSLYGKSKETGKKEETDKKFVQECSHLVAEIIRYHNLAEEAAAKKLAMSPQVILGPEMEECKKDAEDSVRELRPLLEQLTAQERYNLLMLVREVCMANNNLRKFLGTKDPKGYGDPLWEATYLMQRSTQFYTQLSKLHKQLCEKNK